MTTWAVSAGDTLVGRIAWVSQSLVRWSSMKFGQLSKQIEAAEKELEKAQCQAISAENCAARI